jgi:MFS family permease
MGLVGLAHCVSHFSQLLLPPLFPWLKDAFHVSYAELGVLLTVFFVVSCAVQAVSGFVVDRFGRGRSCSAASRCSPPQPSASRRARATRCWCCSPSSPASATASSIRSTTPCSTARSTSRLGHAFSVHGITGSLGWALAPAVLVPIALTFSWRVALASAGVLVLVVLAVLVLNHSRLHIDVTSAAARATKQAGAHAAADGSLGFLRIPAVWMCFGFFFLYAVVLGGVQAFAPEAARQLHDVPVRWAAMCLTFYMVAGAGGMVIGGFLAADPRRCEKIVGGAFGVAAVLALTLGFAPLAPMAVPGLFALMGVASGMAGPSRDLIVKRAAPDGATGRVYGVVYSGPRHRPGVRAARVRPADGPAPARRRVARHRDRASAAHHDRLQRSPCTAHGAAHGDRLAPAHESIRSERRSQTALRCRSMQVAMTSSVGRFHQFSAEKISTSL